MTDWPILLTEEQAAAYMSVSAQTLKRMRTKKEIAPRQMGGSVRYYRPDLDEYAAGLPEVIPQTRRRSA